jgi:uncharacterized protein involved in cysteine biosynthesis
MFIEIIHTLVGLPPSGFEWLEYVASMILALYLYRAVLYMFDMIISIIGGRKVWGK